MAAAAPAAAPPERRRRWGNSAAPAAAAAAAAAPAVAAGAGAPGAGDLEEAEVAAERPGGPSGPAAAAGGEAAAVAADGPASAGPVAEEVAAEWQGGPSFNGGGEAAAAAVAGPAPKGPGAREVAAEWQGGPSFNGGGEAAAAAIAGLASKGPGAREAAPPAAVPAYYGSALRALQTQQDEAEELHDVRAQATGKSGAKGQRKGDEKGGGKGSEAAGKRQETRGKHAARGHQWEQVWRPVAPAAADSKPCAQEPQTQAWKDVSVEEPQTQGAKEVPTEELLAEPSPEALAARIDEMESLEAIYGPDFEKLDETEWRLRLGPHGTLLVYLPVSYPQVDPPTVVVECGGIQAAPILEELVEQWVPGEVCIYQWAEHIRGILEGEGVVEMPAACESDELLAQELDAEEQEFRNELRNGLQVHPHDLPRREAVEIIHGEPIVDRKSTFQAHLAMVDSMSQVQSVKQQLLSNNRIAAATHNIVAYRFRDEAKGGVLVADHDDDGETAAGGRLAELLRLRDALGVFVMVTRWYGGVQLGPERFKHINKSAQILLDQAGLAMPASTKPSSKRGR